MKPRSTLAERLDAAQTGAEFASALLSACEPAPDADTDDDQETEQ